jgi:hypothetical protein
MLFPLSSNQHLIVCHNGLNNCQACAAVSFLLLDQGLLFLSQNHNRHWIHLLSLLEHFLQGKHEARAVPHLWLGLQAEGSCSSRYSWPQVKLSGASSSFS